MSTESDLAPALLAEFRDGSEVRGLLHDVGHGLATLSYLADGLREDPQVPGGVRYRLELMAEELVRLRELLDIRPQPAPERVAVGDLLERLAAVTALSTGVPVAVLPGEDVVLRTDRTLLWRMVSNLVDNAVRAAGSRGRVQIVLEREAGEVAIDVVDDGPGFGEGPAGSASLGLRVVRDLAAECGASVRAVPRQGTEGRGARVRLAFPVERAEASGATAPVRGDDRGGPGAR